MLTCSRLVFVSVSQLVVNAGKLAERSFLALRAIAMISLDCILQHPLSERHRGSSVKAADMSAGDADAPQAAAAARHAEQCATVTGACMCDAQQQISHARQELIQLPQELIQELILPERCVLAR